MDSRQEPAHVDGVGIKARGLRSVPISWTPPFIALDDRFAAKWNKHRTAVDALDRSTRASLDALIVLAQRKGARLVIRSDSATESSHPGKRRTRVANATQTAVEEAVDRAMVEIGPFARPIVQLAVEPALVGLASNERRLTRDPGRFMIEGWPVGSSIRWIRARRDGPARGELTASTLAQLRTTLATVVGGVPVSDGRVRIEWAWDGRCLWLLQINPVEVGAVTTSVEERVTAERYRPLDLAPTRFAGVKTARTQIMLELGIPVPAIAASADSNARDPFAQLEQTVAVFAQRRFVVRTDLRQDVSREPMLLPRSRPTRSVDAIAIWAEEVMEKFRASGLRDDEWSFLTSELIPAGASAWASARPGSDTVVIDAVWGFPDGLLHLPHDSYTISGDSLVARSIAYKPARLDASREGWSYEPMPAPLDWQSVLSPAELLQIANWARRLCRSVQLPVQLMILARIGRRAGIGGLAAFHFTTVDDTRRLSHHPEPFGTTVRVSGLEDLSNLAFALTGESRLAIELDPQPALLRDPSFLEAVAVAAVESSTPILFGGSVLGHAYYLLKAAGAVVVAADPKNVVESGLPVVMVRAPGLARVERISLEQWRVLLESAASPPASACEQDWSDLTKEVMPLRGESTALRPALAALRQGDFGRLARLEEHGEFRLPFRRSAPGTVPLFMDEGATSDANGATDGRSYLRILLPIVAYGLEGRPPKHLVCELIVEWRPPAGA